MRMFNTFKQIHRENTPISNRLQNFLFEYAKAMDETVFSNIQLRLWRCLEIATGRPNHTRSGEEIILILSKYSKDLIWKQQGNIIREFRNAFVHEGLDIEATVWHSGDRYLFWTQQYVDAALRILLWMRSNNIGKKPSGTEEIDYFWNIYKIDPGKSHIASKLFRSRKTQ